MASGPLLLHTEVEWVVKEGRVEMNELPVLEQGPSIASEQQSRCAGQAEQGEKNASHHDTVGSLDENGTVAAGSVLGLTDAAGERRAWI